MFERVKKTEKFKLYRSKIFLVVYIAVLWSKSCDTVNLWVKGATKVIMGKGKRKSVYKNDLM